MLKKIILISILLLGGCKSFMSPTFINAMSEHKKDTKLVTDSLIGPFKVERIDEQNNANRPEAIAAFDEIISNLQAIARQAKVLDDYVWKNITEDELSRFLKNKWRANPLRSQD